MSKKVIENLKKEIQSLMNKDFDLRKSIEKLEHTIHTCLKIRKKQTLSGN